MSSPASGTRVYRVETVVQVMVVVILTGLTVAVAFPFAIALFDGRVHTFQIVVLLFLAFVWRHVLLVAPRQITVDSDGRLDADSALRSRAFRSSDVTMIRVRWGQQIDFIVAGKRLQPWFPDTSDLARQLLELNPSIDLRGGPIQPANRRWRRQSRWIIVPFFVAVVGWAGGALAEHNGHDDSAWRFVFFAGWLGVVGVIFSAWRKR